MNRDPDLIVTGAVVLVLFVIYAFCRDVNEPWAAPVRLACAIGIGAFAGHLIARGVTG